MYISTGSTILNLALSDTIYGGIKTGKMMNLIGDSSAGKTLLSLSCLARACHQKGLEKHKKYYDDVEASAEFNLEALFGKKAADEIVSPYEEGGRSESIEQFYFTIDTLLDKGEPFIYILDSMDALSTNSEEELFDNNKKAFEANKAGKQSYGDGKAKINSQSLRQIMGRLQDTDSALIIVSQTRDNIGDMYNPKIRAGGKSLKFYASYEVWLSLAGKLKTTVNGTERVTGVQSKAKITKNKVTGKFQEVEFPIYYSCGVDDLGGCVDWLCEEGVWKKAAKGGYIDSPYGNKRKEDLIQLIYKEKKGKEVRELMQAQWDKIIEACKVNREMEDDDAE